MISVLVVPTQLRRRSLIAAAPLTGDTRFPSDGRAMWRFRLHFLPIPSPAGHLPQAEAGQSALGGNHFPDKTIEASLVQNPVARCFEGK